MKNVYLLVIFLFVSFSVLSQETKYRYIVTFKDKGNYEEAMKDPHLFLSSRSIDRREKQGLSLDYIDAPLNKDYIDEIAGHFRVVGKSKWLNLVMIETDSRLEDGTYVMPDFVESAELVGTYTEESFSRTYCSKDIQGSTGTNHHGVMHKILSANGIVDMHNAGFRGKGKLIAVIDDGFCNIDDMEGGWEDNIICIKDFVNGCDDMMYQTGGHGTGVLSCMATDLPEKYVGSAPDAEYVLLRSEYLEAEEPAEQYYWTFAAEYADSIGVDIINTSLGYNNFDSEFADFLKEDLDGSSPMSRSVDIAVSRGMVVVCAAGNEGRLEWRLITVPADAFDVLSVGGLANGSLTDKADFSSVGPTADGRVKPDTMAPGISYYVNTGGSVSLGNGTSYASPIFAGGVACLWEALPDLTSYEIVDMIRRGGSLYLSPNDNMGNGVSNLYDIYMENRPSGISGVLSENIRYSNSCLYIPDFLVNSNVALSVYSPEGVNIHSGIIRETPYDLSFVPSGIYVVSVKSEDCFYTFKILRK